MNKLSEKLRFKLLEIALLATLLTSSVTFAQNEDFPKHLMLARELLVNVSKDKNRYTHTDQISFPSDRFSSGYAMNADCSGFVAAFLSRSASVTLNQMVKVTGNRTRPLSEDFTLSILKERGFKRVNRIEDVRPGDIFAWEFSNFLDAKAARNTGHTMIIDTIPKKIKSRGPVLENTEQYKIWVIDSSRGPHGPDDTRRQDKEEEIDGLGRGRFRLYVDDQGNIIGYAKNFKKLKI